eukprot:TRINITY_DN16005_c0_g1_i1.p1 TRINITY_DN16005_c0_g1~~TRINITY_DN16005_c0_g1_i1.p1  ORF type:complete len:120 (-),score=5.85 TRINITY_DN16005_c0_g1_i1:114-473(-)
METPIYTDVSHQTPNQPLLTSQPTVYVPPAYGSGPPPSPVLIRWPLVSTRVTCQYCGQTITTIVERQVGFGNWLFTGLCCLFGCWLGCCLIPLCIDDLKNVVHHCPVCHHTVGIKKRFD